MKTACIVFALLLLAQNPAKKPDRGNAQNQKQADNAATALGQAQPVTVNCNQSAGTIAQHDSKETPKWYATVEWANWALVFVAGITGFLIWIQASETAKATQAMLRQVEVTTDTAERQLRAYLCVSRSEVKFPMEGIAVASVHVKNCGVTPAYEVRHWIHTWLEAHPLSVSLPTPAEDFKMSTAILGASDFHIMESEPHVIDPNWIPAFGTKMATLYVYGRIEYRDVFGKTRFTNYRLIYGGMHNRPKTKEGNGILSHDVDGNDAS
jgi:hypothetical protein